MNRQSSQHAVRAFSESFSCREFGAFGMDLDEADYEVMAAEAEREALEKIDKANKRDAADSDTDAKAEKSSPAGLSAGKNPRDSVGNLSEFRFDDGGRETEQRSLHASSEPLHTTSSSPSPFNSQSSEELEGAASQVSNSIGGHDEEHQPSKPAANQRTKLKRRSSLQRRPSLKEMASGFARRLSAQHKQEAGMMRHQHSAPINRLGSDCTMSPYEMKIHEFKEIPSSPEEFDVPASSKGNRERKKEMNIPPFKSDKSTFKSNSARRPNRKQSRRQTATSKLTTSGIFKKLMIGVADDDAVPPPTMAKSKSFRRHRRKTVNDLCDDLEDDDAAQDIRAFAAAPPASAASAPPLAATTTTTTTTTTKPRRSAHNRRQRATFDTTARPSPAMTKGLRAGSNKSFSSEIAVC